VMASVDKIPRQPLPLSVSGLRVMTDARAHLSLDGAIAISDLEDPRMINSIFRPLFPLREEWNKLKSAY